jgi:hypothetical protein
MTDHLDKAKRSWNMSRFRGKDTPHENGGSPGFRPDWLPQECLTESIYMGSVPHFPDIYGECPAFPPYDRSSRQGKAIMEYEPDSW